jgi:hydroxypyruvate isomerase
MPRFAANLTMLWPDLEPLARFGAAREHGFDHVEMLFPHELDAAKLDAALRDNRQQMVLFDPAAGNWGTGERGMLCMPGREAEFASTLADAVELAGLLGTRRLNALAGIVPAGVTREEATEVALANLRRAAPVVARAGITLLVESINATDMPGYLLDTAERAAKLVEAVESPSVRLQFDQYHVAMSGADPLQEFHRYAPLIAHVQIADVPGRHEPGTGKQPIAAFLEELDRSGYDGFVGLEYRPLAKTGEGLRWLDTIGVRGR